MQHIFFLLYYKFKDENITQDIVQEVLKEILNYKISIYRALLDTFTIN